LANLSHCLLYPLLPLSLLSLLLLLRLLHLPFEQHSSRPPSPAHNAILVATRSITFCPGKSMDFNVVFTLKYRRIS
jgi:hypothetical protein